jgi:hypothetical protein
MMLTIYKLTKEEVLEDLIIYQNQILVFCLEFIIEQELYYIFQFLTASSLRS